jgi:hypothetical protein
MEDIMRLTGLILATVGFATPATAEFVMVSPPATDAAATPAAPSTAPMRPKPRPKIRPAAPDPALVGFGDRVPLRFAVRQIVPARFQVAFGETVDRDASVDWKGGKAWRPTLSDALRPLGLTASVVGAAVTIEPVPTPR